MKVRPNCPTCETNDCRHWKLIDAAPVKVAATTAPATSRSTPWVPATRTSTAMEPLILTGGRAATIWQRAAYALARNGGTWTECAILDEITCGCKLFARNWGTGVKFMIFHSSAYGCARGGDLVPVLVQRDATATGSGVRRLSV